MSIHALPIAERAPGAALALGPALVDRARADRASWIAASVVRGPAIVLGAPQHAGRVVDLAACARDRISVMRRATTGTAASLGDVAILWTLALPHVAALMPDATARTLLNRNVRGFLEGFQRAGAPAHYFGREWIAVRRQPAAVLGYDVDEDGAVLLEVLASWDRGVDLPKHLVSAEELAVDRYAGKTPIVLGEILQGKAPSEVAEIVVTSVASRAGAEIEWSAIEEGAPFAPITSARDPIPDDLAIAPPVRVPIGWIDLAAKPGQAPWIGGDVLAPRSLLKEIARRVAIGADTTDLAGASIDGARLADLVDAARSAIAFTSAAPE